MAVADVLAGAGHDPAPVGSPTLTDVAAAYAAIETASGPAAKSAIMRDLLARADPLTAKYIVKVLGGELRIGLREGLVEAAIAKAFDRQLDDVKWAGMLTGDVGALATLAREGRLGAASLAVFHPIKFMLASPAEDAAEILKRLGPEVWVEDKYDGIRAQLHKQGARSACTAATSTMSAPVPGGRRGRAPICPGTGSSTARSWPGGTAVLPFISLQARLGRKSPSAAILEEIPVIYVAFDVLGLGRRRRRAGRRAAPRAARRAATATRRHRPATGRRWRSLRPVAPHPATDRRPRGRVRGGPRPAQRGPDGQGPHSGYSPGRRGLGWLKMKKALATIDCVVVGVEVGHGKRHGVLSDYTFAVRDTENDRLVNIGKAYSGLTDAEIAEMTRWFEEHTIARFGRYRQVEPTVVVEVAFDVIVRSNRHQSGFSLRFPRIAALRPDKPPDEIDTLETVGALYEGLQHGGEHLVTAGARTDRSTGRARVRLSGGVADVCFGACSTRSARAARSR